MLWSRVQAAVPSPGGGAESRSSPPTLLTSADSRPRCKCLSPATRRHRCQRCPRHCRQRTERSCQGSAKPCRHAGARGGARRPCARPAGTAPGQPPPPALRAGPEGLAKAPKDSPPPTLQAQRCHRRCGLPGSALTAVRRRPNLAKVSY